MSRGAACLIHAPWNLTPYVHMVAHGTACVHIVLACLGLWAPARQPDSDGHAGCLSTAPACVIARP